MSKPINEVTVADIEKFDMRGDLNTYQTLATRSAIYPGQGSFVGLDYVTLKLNGEAGELAEHVGKAMRDDNMITIEYHTNDAGTRYGTIVERPLTPERRTAIIKEVGDCLWYLSAVCNELGISLHYAARENLVKLADRSRRNQLQGAGDDR